RNIPPSALPHKFRHELHCNEVMLLPYYVASMNIEHAYYEATGKYEPFEGIVLVDTFRTLEPPQTEFAFLSEKNSARVERQKRTPIRVVIANPPYNAWQIDENENNRNQKYVRIDQRVKETYSEDSKAQNKNSLSDPYVKAFRYASDKIADAGVIAYVTNGAFVDSLSCDGMRKNLAREFDFIYLLDLGGNVRKNPKLSGTTHNVFGIQVGVCITLLVKLPGKPKDSKRSAKIFYHAVPVDWRREKKYEFLELKQSVDGVKWQKLQPDKKQNWLDMGLREEFDVFMPIGDRDLAPGNPAQPIFSHYSRGIATSRDDTAVNFNRERLKKNMEAMIDAYNGQVDAYHRLKKKPAKVEDFIDYESGKVAWSRDLKNDLLRHRKAEFTEDKIRPSLYRPFNGTWLYFDRVMNEEVYGYPEIFPKLNSTNLSICVTDAASEKPFMVLATDKIADLHIVGAGASSQCFSLYQYVEDTNKKKFERRDNITSKALTLFQIFYDDDSITREDIFNYVYALLHHPAYRSRYAENLKRELPRIPFVGVGKGKAAFFSMLDIPKMQGEGKPDHDATASAKLFYAFAAAGKKLVDLHVQYESAKAFPLKRIENKEVPLNWRVESMKLTKDKTSILYNDFLTLSGIPPEVFDYRLGNRSALDWVIDQYRVTKDEHGKITSDPNRMDDEEYIVRLIGQVITVSLETQNILATLPKIYFD
ncbi:MAG: DNA helicase, partial [Verrucomicrobiota bacterium]|nr:DNA helicase [Verrucomicrobiota bacterium]